MKPKLVLFDALFTIVKPRLPIHVQYAEVFKPYFVLDPANIKTSFKTALKEVQQERPAYGPAVVTSGTKIGSLEPKDNGKLPEAGTSLGNVAGVEGWWNEVIWRTAVRAGADPAVVGKALPVIVPRLMDRFSSKEGYALFDDTLPTIQRLKELGVRVGLVSNCDARMRNALLDLGVLDLLDPVLISEEVGIEKPSKEIWTLALRQSGIQELEEGDVVHVGDELKADYEGAHAAGLQGVLIRRPGPEGEGERKEANEDLNGVRVIHGLEDLVDLIQPYNESKRV